jgi:hypothetical protein
MGTRYFDWVSYLVSYGKILVLYCKHSKAASLLLHFISHFKTVLQFGAMQLEQERFNRSIDQCTKKKYLRFLGGWIFTSWFPGSPKPGSLKVGTTVSKEIFAAIFTVEISSKMFWRSCISLGITESFGLRPSFGILKNIMFRKLDLFLSSGEKVGGTYWNGSVRNN